MKNVEPTLHHWLTEREKKKLAKQRYQERINEKVNDWYTFSTTPQTEEDIKARILSDNESGEDSCCISYICKYSRLSEEMIEWIDANTMTHEKSTMPKCSKLDWDYISCFQKLSEEFIEKHNKDVNWKLIFQCQDLSLPFKVRHNKDLIKQEQLNLNTGQPKMRI